MLLPKLITLARTRRTHNQYFQKRRGLVWSGIMQDKRCWFKGAYGLAGYLSAGMYFDHPINTASNIKTKCLFLMLEITVIGQVSLGLSVWKGATNWSICNKTPARQCFIGPQLTRKPVRHTGQSKQQCREKEQVVLVACHWPAVLGDYSSLPFEANLLCV